MCGSRERGAHPQLCCECERRGALVVTPYLLLVKRLLCVGRGSYKKGKKNEGVEADLMELVVILS